MTDDQLRELYARALAGGASLPGNGSGQCVTPEKLLGLVRREGTEEQRLQTLDHVMACEACRRELDLLKTIEQAGVEMGAAGTEGRFGWQKFARLALAASLLLAVGIALGIRHSGDSADVPRGGAAAVVLLAPPERIAEGQPVTFAWHPVRNAHQYVFELLDAGSGRSGTTAFVRTTSDTSLVLEPAEFRRGQEYQWWVRALTPAGELTSPMRALRVRE